MGRGSVNTTPPALHRRNTYQIISQSDCRDQNDSIRFETSTAAVSSVPQKWFAFALGLFIGLATAVTVFLLLQRFDFTPKDYHPKSVGLQILSTIT